MVIATQTRTIHHFDARASHTASMTSTATASRTGVPEGYMTLTKVAADIGASWKTIRHYTATGALPAVRVGRRWYVRREDLSLAAALYDPKQARLADRVPTRVRLARVLDNQPGQTTSELGTALDLHPHNARKWVATLASQGYAEHADGWRWRLTDAGRAWLAEQIETDESREGVASG